MTIQLQGMDELRKAIRRGDQKVTLATAQVVDEAVLEIEAKSMELVPLDTGDLRNSRKVKRPKKARSLKRIFGSVTYGDGLTYAAVQHERTDFFHPSKKRGGTGPVRAGEGRGPKYLQHPTERVASKFQKNLLKEINKRIKALS